VSLQILRYNKLNRVHRCHRNLFSSALPYQSLIARNKEISRPLGNRDMSGIGNAELSGVQVFRSRSCGCHVAFRRCSKSLQYHYNLSSFFRITDRLGFLKVDRRVDHDISRVLEVGSGWTWWWQSIRVCSVSDLRPMPE